MRLSSERRPRRPQQRGAREVDARGLARALERAIEGEVRFDEGSRALYAVDASNYRQVPIGVVVPKSEEDVLTTLRICRGFDAPVLSRGGGTSLAGQCCNVAVVMDFTKYLHRILHIDPERRIARVQPGVILDELGRAANKCGLTFWPDPSTHNHCTLGGMIGNNSCGVHSEVAARTVDNVESLEIATYDGLRLRVGPTSDDALSRIIAEGGRRGELYGAMKRLRDEYLEEIRTGYPSIPRRVSGYNLDELLPERGFHVARALVGSEGTLVTVLHAEVKLHPHPAFQTLVVLGFEDIFQAADAVPFIKQFAPIGLEGVDEKLVRYERTKRMHGETLHQLPPGKGWLFAEFGGDSRDEAEARAQALVSGLKQRGTPAPSVALFRDRSQEHAVWAVRESGLGATARVPGGGQTWPGWEDSAVAPERMGDYLRDFRALLDRHGYDASLYGHFGQGCLHCRIDFDLKSAEGVRRYHRFVSEAANLVVGYGGSLSGEHGDGQSRAELLPKMYGPRLLEAMRQFKRIWDPGNRMNPGKVIDPHGITEDLRFGPGYSPQSPKTAFSFSESGYSFVNASERCVGVGLCRKTEGGTMCPSYMVTREEKHSTRGRAHLLHEMLVGGTVTRGWRSDAVKDALDLCLACKGCKHECPVNVDMATWKAEFLHHYYQGRKRPRHAYAFGLVMHWAKVGGRIPGLANFVTHAPGLSTFAKWAAGMPPQREIPLFGAPRFQKRVRHRSTARAGAPRVILYPDTFNNHFHPDTAMAALEVLEAGGFDVVVPQQSTCCGRPLFDYGMLDEVKRLHRKVLETFRTDIRAGTPFVVLEPSCAASFRDELPDLFPHDLDAQRLKHQVFTLDEFLKSRGDAFPLPKLSQKALVHGHCHHKSVLGFSHAEPPLLEKLGLDAEILDSGCCGMAGSFGFEADKYEISMKVGERVLLPRVREAEADTLIVADGFSCREQIAQGTPRRALHLAQVLHRALRPAGTLPDHGGERALRRVRRTVQLTFAALGGVALFRSRALLAH